MTPAKAAPMREDVTIAVKAMGWTNQGMICAAYDCANGIPEKPYPHNRLTVPQIVAFRDVLKGVQETLDHIARPRAGEEFVERVAKAIYYSHANNPEARWECVEPNYQETVWRKHARAALAALPSDPA